MKYRSLTGALVMALTAGVAACDVDQTQEGELPEVEIEEGQFPEYDVQTGDVEMGVDTAEVVVPDVDVEFPPDTLR